MIIVTSWDDGAYEDLKLAELLKKYSLPAIFYWPVESHTAKNLSKVKRFLNQKDRKKIAESFEIGGHGVTHAYLTNIEPDDAKKEILDCRKIFQQEFSQPINSFCYPRGYANSNIKQFVSEAGFISARSTQVGNTALCEDQFYISTTVHAGIPRIEYKELHWLDYALKKLDSNPEYFHIFGHSWELERENSWSDLEKLFKKIYELL